MAQRASLRLPARATSAASSLAWGRIGTFAILIGVLIAAFGAVLAWGSVNIPLDEIIRVLTGGEASRESWTNIILKVRLPKATTAVLAGAALSVAGLLMQTLFRNPLADPFALGISSGASLGVAIMVLSAGTAGGALLTGFGLTGDLAVTAAASIGAGVVMVLALAAARRVAGSVTLLILGLMFGYISGALVTLLMHAAIPERIQAYTNWTFGSFGGVTWGQMPVFAIVILVGLVSALALSKSLNALLMGEAVARSLGLNVRRARISIVIAAAVLAGGVTAFCGPIGFIGIAVPHICRGLFRTADHRTLISASLIVGAAGALIASLIAETPGTHVVLPLNAIMALAGAPIVIGIVLRQRATRSAFGDA